MEEGELFVWRDTITAYQSFSDGNQPAANADRLARIWSNSTWPQSLNHLSHTHCLYCNNQYKVKVENPNIHKVRYTYCCRTCGFSWSWSDESLYGGGSRDNHEAYLAGEIREADGIQIDASSLLKLTVNDSRLGLDELGSHLRRRYSDVYNLDWRIFEELVADIYRNLGYHAHVTKKTRDGGYDVILLERLTQEKIVVEVKRYAEGQKVGLNIVDRVLGVQLRTGIKRAKIVASSAFTSCAKAAADAAGRASSYELDLVDADSLLRALEVYNVTLPPLWKDKRLTEPTTK